MQFELQPLLENKYVKARLLKPEDFETLYKVASDPLIWEQHPNPDRYKREVFEMFFKGALESGGAFLVLDAKTGESIGSSRFFESEGEPDVIAVGYTFIARSHWGGVYNRQLKALMLGHAFKYVDKVYFHIGAENIRSQKAIGRLGAEKVGEVEMEYYGEACKLNFIYCITKVDWQLQTQNYAD